MRSFCIFLAAIAVSANGGSWVTNTALKLSSEKKVPVTPPKVTINLDLPPEQRWVEVAGRYKDKAPEVIAYLEEYIPKWVIPIVETIGKDIRPFFRDYGDEMIGVASAMGLKIGDVVAMNLVYQLERIGVNCSDWNNTGPTVPNDPGCMKTDPSQKICYCHTHQDLIDEDGMLRVKHTEGPGLCTSVVAQDTHGNVLHGRNLDWNFPSVLREMIVDIDFQRRNKTVFTGTGIVGFAGLLNGMRYDDSGKGVYSVSIDARAKGGKVFENLGEALLHKAMTPTQHLRKTFETQGTWDLATNYLSTGYLVDQIYYICAGSQADQGMVVSRDRNNGNGIFNKPADKWTIGSANGGDAAWFRLQTNYDHWNPAPVADNRRDPGIKLMNAMGQEKLNTTNLLEVMHTWPVYNHHTDYTGMFVPSASSYSSVVWLGE